MNYSNQVLERWTLLGAVLLLLVVALGRPFAQFDNVILDAHLNALRQWSQPTDSSAVVIIGIDDATLAQYTEPLALWHEHLGSFFAALATAAPRAVVVDLVLPERSYDTLVPGLDRKLLLGLVDLKRAARIVLARTVDQSGNMRPLHAPLRSLMGEEQFALALVRPDSDGTVRLLTSHLATESGQLLTLSGRLVGDAVTSENQVLINYLQGAPFTYTPMQDIANLSSDQLKTLFQEKIIVVGSVLPFADRHRVPVPLAAWEPESIDVPGMLVHAQQIRTLLDEVAIQKANHWWVALLALFAIGLWWLGKRSWWVISVAISSIIVTLFATAALLKVQHVWLPPSLILFAIALFALTRVAFTAYCDWREKRQLKSAFAGAVSPQVLEDLMQGRIGRKLGNQRRDICVMFADINQFTTRSEQQTPDAMIEMLNRYFGEMADAIHQYQGTLDKFIGDGLMAFFGAPNALPASCQSAFDAARDMFRRLDELNEEFVAAGLEPLSIKIGLHFGPAAIGHVGSDARNEYTAIGDTVNVAARLEGFAKKTDYEIVCSAVVAEALDESLDDLGTQSLKGHSDMRVFGWK